MSESENNSAQDSRLAWLQKWLPNLKVVKRAIVAVVGFSVLLVGVAMIVLPGPAFIVIPLGLAILATEFVWAARLLQKAKDFFKKKGACVECGKKIDKKLLATDPPSTLCAVCCAKSAEGEAKAPSVPQISE